MLVYENSTCTYKEERKVALEWTESEGTYVEAAQNYFAQKSAWFIFTKKVYIAKNVVVF